MGSIIYHIIDASSGHHAPNVIKNTLQYSLRCGVRADQHCFILHNYDANLNATLNEAIKEIDLNKVLYVEKRDGWLGLRKLLATIQTKNGGILIHGLNHHYLWFTLFTFSRRFLSRIIWICWGAGTTRSESLKRKFTVDIVKQFVLRHIKYVVVLLNKDKALLAEHFGCKDVMVTPYLSQSIDFSSPIYQVRKSSAGQSGYGKRLRILVGNSAWETNNHLEVFEHLAPYKDEQIEVFCPLSYGTPNRIYIDNVLGEGKRLFGERFSPITNLLPTPEYMALINSVDIIVIYADRQMALFALYAGVNLGKKIVLKRGGANFDWFSSVGVRIFDFDDFIDFASFATPLTQEEQLVNRNGLASIADIGTLSKNWKKVYGMLLG